MAADCVSPLGHGCCGCIDRQPGEGAGNAGKRGNSPKPDFLLAQILLMTRLGHVPRGGTMGMRAGLCRGTGRDESSQLCAQLEDELRRVQRYSHHLSFCLPPAVPFYGAVVQGQPSSSAMLLVPVWRDPQEPHGA